MYPPNLNGASKTKVDLFEYCMSTAKVPAKDQAEIIKTLKTLELYKFQNWIFQLKELIL